MTGSLSALRATVPVTTILPHAHSGLRSLHAGLHRSGGVLLLHAYCIRLLLHRMPHVLEIVAVGIAGFLVFRERIDALAFVRPLVTTIGCRHHGPVTLGFVRGIGHDRRPRLGATAAARAWTRRRIFVERVERHAFRVGVHTAACHWRGGMGTQAEGRNNA